MLRFCLVLITATLVSCHEFFIDPSVVDPSFILNTTIRSRQASPSKTRTIQQFPSGPILPQFFDIIGPFPAGIRELGGDVLEAFGGIREAWNKYSNGDTNASYPSELVDGGRAKWKRVALTGNDCRFGYGEADGVRWEKLTNAFGPPVLLFSAWAVGNFTPTISGEFMFSCYRCGGFYLDDQYIHGDPYSTGSVYTPATLVAGKTYMIFISVRGYASANFAIGVEPITRHGNGVLVLLPGALSPIGYFYNEKRKEKIMAGNILSFPVMNKGLTTLSNFTATLKDNKSNERWPVKILQSPVAYYRQVAVLVIDLGDDVRSGNVEIQISAPGLETSLAWNSTYQRLNSDQHLRVCSSLTCQLTCTV
jgi:hypothetical protein